MAFVILVLIALVGVIVLTTFLVKSCGTMLTARNVPLASGGLCTGTGDGILYVKAGMLNYYSYKDEDNNFSKYLSGSPTGIVGSKGLQAVWSENAIQIIDAPFDITPKGRVTAVRAGERHIAVCTERTDGGRIVTVFSSTGQQVYEKEFSDGALLNFGFSEVSGQTLWTMELSVDSGATRTTVTTFDLSRMSATGVISVSGQLVEDVYFTGSSVFIIGTETLIRYSASANREIYRVKLHGYRVADISPDGENVVFLLLPRNADGLKTVRVLTVAQAELASESAISLNLGSGTVGCHLVGGNIIVVGENTASLYDRKGRIIETVALPVGSTLSSMKLDEKHILMERSGEFDLLAVGK